MPILLTYYFPKFDQCFKQFGLQLKKSFFSTFRKKAETVLYKLIFSKYLRYELYFELEIRLNV